jgi:hypothetical protein
MGNWQLVSNLIPATRALVFFQESRSVTGMTLLVFAFSFAMI